ncbi:protein BREVIS RADIX isoform X2 [Herrania umbratica]|uniref:Protein BREVIS RADIX isoform X2 n=1 Tax=Herrania umbratica TaxID=108875 RepID=A0A6J0ZQH8_9ROSI|nr:protein BREVIS RADIX isoform X2 [Herrania umbratica]
MKSVVLFKSLFMCCRDKTVAKREQQKKMFTCIACTKQMADGGEEVEGARGSGTPSTKEAVKSLTAQIKDMALKFSGAYKQCKPCTGSSNYKKGHRPYPDFDAASEGVPYPYMGGSSSSTPAWDFTSASHHPGRSDSRFTGVFSGDRTPGGMDSMFSQDLVLEDEDEPKEWMAQVEPGVHITFVSLPNGGNDLKRIRFSREMFNKWQAQRWWGENYDRIMELYNVQRFNRQALHTPPRCREILLTQGWDQQWKVPCLIGHQDTTINPLEVKAISHQQRIWTKVGPNITVLGQVLTVQVVREVRHLLMLHGRQPHLGMSLLFLSAMPVKWRRNGLNKMSPGYTLPSGSWLMAPGSSGVSDSAARDLEK